MKPSRRLSLCITTLAAAVCGPLFGPEAMADDGESPITFTDLAIQAGLHGDRFGRGSAMIDLDGDGLLDIIAGNDGQINDFYLQRPNHHFYHANDELGIEDVIRPTWGTLVTDFDNDGDPDVYFVNGGFVGNSPNRLLRNDLNETGQFTDVSAEAGDAAGNSKNFGGCALDYDRDGDIDIFVTTTDHSDACQLLRNDGDLVFTDVSAQAGITHGGASRHCSAGDVDNDRWPDIAVGDQVGPNFLYWNKGNGEFRDVAGALGIQSPGQNFGMVLDDFNNDGWMDVYMPKFQNDPVRPSELWLNKAQASFVNVTEDAGLTGQQDMGHGTFDVDADGYPDIYIGTGNPQGLWYDKLFLITPAGEDSLAGHDVSDASGITSEGPTRCHGMAYGDFDNDGFIDIYVNNGGPAMIPSTAQRSFLWHSNGNANRWTALRLEGVESNRSAVGTRCVAFTDSGRAIHRAVRVGHGFTNTNSPVLHFGVYENEIIDRILVRWPSGLDQMISSPPLFEVIDFTEGSSAAASWIEDDVLLPELLYDWGPCPSGCPGDLNRDRRVDLDDLIDLIGRSR